MFKSKLAIIGWLIFLGGMIDLGYTYIGAPKSVTGEAHGAGTTDGGVIVPEHQHPNSARKVAKPRPNTVMKIPPGRYEAIENADHFLTQLCEGAQQCAIRREDLKAFRQAYDGMNIGFGQINLAEHHEYAALRQQAAEASRQAAEAAKQAPKAPPAVPEVEGQEVTQIPAPILPRAYFDSCSAQSPQAVTYVLDTGGPDLIEGIICTAAELERFIHENAEISPRQTPTFSSQPFYDRALLAERLDEQAKPSMVTVWLKHAGKRDGVGSGFVVGVDTAGRCEITTAHHVTDDKQATVEVTLSNGQTYPATIALEKAERELTILRVAGVENPAETCQPLKIVQGAVAADQQVFMATIPLPEQFDPEAERWTRDASDNTGKIAAIKAFSPLPNHPSPYQVGQDVVVIGIQGYQGDSGTPTLNLNLEVIGVNFVTHERGGITFAVPAPYLIEALDELHKKDSGQL